MTSDAGGDVVDDGLLTPLVLHNLVDLGLTEDEAKIYVCTLVHGNASGTHVARTCSLDTSTVYHRIQQLVDMNLLQKQSGPPAKYIAVAPADCINLLMQKQQALLEKKRDLCNSTLVGLSRLASSNQEEKETPDFALLQTVEKIHDESLKSLELARVDRSIIIDSHIFENWKIDKRVKMREAFQASYDRGVKLRIITEVVPPYVEEIKKYSKFAEIRHHASIGLTFEVMDRKRAIIGAGTPRFRKTGKHMPAVLTGLPNFVDGLACLFEFIWNQSGKYSFGTNCVV